MLKEESFMVKQTKHKRFASFSAGTASILLAALLLRLWTGPADPWLLNWYADYVQAMAAVLLGTSLIGPLLLEDVLRRST